MLNVQMKGAGLFEFYRQQAEKLRVQPTTWLRLRAPPGIGAVQTFSGRHLNIGPDGAAEVSAQDAEFLMRVDWIKIANWEMGVNPDPRLRSPAGSERDRAYAARW
jgi:hypothetical protein